jgi:hypothetical protein
MTAEGEALLRKPVKDLLQVLDPTHFKQIHRSNHRQPARHRFDLPRRHRWAKGLLRLKSARKR